MAKQANVPHSWAIDSWPEHVFPNDRRKARYLVRVHRTELIAVGALSRVGRTLIVLGDRYDRWLQKQSGRVPGFQIAANQVGQVHGR